MMLKLFTTFAYSIAITLVCLMTLSNTCSAHEQKPLNINLAISFDLEQSALLGTMRVEISLNHTLTLELDGLTVTGAVLSSPQRENQVVSLQDHSSFTLSPVPYDRVLTLSYQRTVTGDYRDIISNEAIVLTSRWHPIPDHKSIFSLQSHVPPGFTAISESDTFPGTGPDGVTSFSFSQPVYGLTFAAAPYVKESRKVRDELFIHTLFLAENQHLANGYLDSAVEYIERYEEQIGQFPYNHYLIVENINPTGFGLPTFTLLGGQVLRLPFIRETSLGHEILHSWFGNSVSVSDETGNWSEGLTTYLADMAYRQDQGEGNLARLEKTREFFSYVKDDTPPLKKFRYGGHSGGNNRAIRAVGYGRSAMLFHELEELIGTELFIKTIREVYRRYKADEASWHDIQTLFEETSSLDLQRFFSERLNSVNLPDLLVKNIDTDQGADTASLSFTVEQKSPEPFELQLPFSIETSSGKSVFTRPVNGTITDINVEVEGIPLELVIDESYDIMRTLSEKEYAPVWSQLMGSGKTTLVLADDSEREIYQPILDLAQRYSWQIKGTSEIDSINTTDGYLIFLGLSSTLSRMMFGTPPHPEDGFTLDIHSHPSNGQQPVALISSSSAVQSAAAASRLSHYGKYSYLHFMNGRLLEKNIRQGTPGIRMAMGERPTGFSITQLRNFDELIEQLNRYQVIYVGESHTSRADHLLQYMIIEALHQKNHEIAIGMEMFPRSSQQALNDYIHGEGAKESDFLQQSRYYDVWGYDFRLFRPIFSYAKKHGIDIVGLNVDRNIVSSVFKSNGLGNLPPEQLEELPAELVLDMKGYAERLSDTFSAHGDTERAAGSLNGFIVAQAIWDETMAESIYRYLSEHPSRKMVILAGSQHTRKDSGIPPRVERRKEIFQASVHNLATSRLAAAELRATSDYLFLLDVPDFPPHGKIGIVLQQSENKEIPGMKILDINPSSDAQQAGIIKEDILTHIDAHPVMNMADVRTAMLDKSVGEIITIVVKRVGKNKRVAEHTFDVTLFNPEMNIVHP